MTDRRVLKVPRGKVKEHLDLAKMENCPEIQEVDGLKVAELYIEHIPDSVKPVDWQAELAKAKTTDERVDVLIRMLTPGG